MEAVTELRFALDGRWLVVGGAGTVRLHDAGTGTALPGDARAVAVVPDGYWAIHPDGSVRLHDATGAAVRDLDLSGTSNEDWEVAGLRLVRPGDLPEPSTG
ncbi:hypothetical protein [Dactylosporangium sp. CA-092794]|uniref:hypothetical protein n=1 Tax=Dactylosporangium sp. CA-092794 TaxID=3239929 RepID=UPI003D930463